MYAQAFECDKCHVRIKRPYPLIEARITFYFSRYTCCIRCGNPRVHRLARRDGLDAMSKSPVGQLLRLTGAPLYKCNICRLQYYDWRPIQARVAPVSTSATR